VADSQGEPDNLDTDSPVDTLEVACSPVGSLEEAVQTVARNLEEAESCAAVVVAARWRFAAWAACLAAGACPWRKEYFAELAEVERAGCVQELRDMECDGAGEALLEK
jgi:hypothetical protein